MMNQITETITKILKICGENKISFKLGKEGEENFTKYIPEKELIINIPNQDDEELYKMLTEKLEELQNLFK